MTLNPKKPNAARLAIKNVKYCESHFADVRDPLDPDYQNTYDFEHDDSGSDSDAEGGLGNVIRMVMRPPGHSGKAKRGHLCFDASFEGGNLGRVDFITEYEYDLFIRPDTCNPRYRVWFNFVVDNVRTDQRVIFNIVNFSKTKLLYRDGMAPLVKSTSRPKWQRIPSRFVYYHRSPEHRNHYVLSFAFAFDKEEDVYQFAFAYPYSYSRLQAYMEQLDCRNFPYYNRELLAQSVQQRCCDLITIGNSVTSSTTSHHQADSPAGHPSDRQFPTSAAPVTAAAGSSSAAANAASAGKKQRTIVILSRSHAGDSPTSFICQGLIDLLVSTHPIAQLLREHVTFKIIPMLNPDGVFLGNYRTSVMGMDLNRQWPEASKWGHPTIYAAKNLIAELDEDKSIDLDFVLDLHAHSSLLGNFIYGSIYDDVYRYERHIVFPKMMSQVADDYNPNNCVYNRDPAKANSARRFLCEHVKDSVNCYSLEVSFYGYHLEGNPNIIPYTEEGYMRLGRNIARAFLEYYKFMGIIPQNVYTGLPSTGDKGKGRGTAQSGPIASSEGSGGARRGGMSKRSVVGEPPSLSGDGTAEGRKKFSIGMRHRSEERGSELNEHRSDSNSVAGETASLSLPDGHRARSGDDLVGEADLHGRPRRSRSTRSLPEQAGDGDSDSAYSVTGSVRRRRSGTPTSSQYRCSLQNLDFNPEEYQFRQWQRRVGSPDRIYIQPMSIATQPLGNQQISDTEAWRRLLYTDATGGLMAATMKGYPKPIQYPRAFRMGAAAPDAYALAQAQLQVTNPKMLKIIDVNKMTRGSIEAYKTSSTSKQ